MSEHAQVLTEDNFDQALQQDLLLVDFWADWCQPCQMLAPLIEEASRDYQGRVLVGKVDVEASATIAERFAVRNLPTLLLFSGGQEVARQTGVLNKARLTHWINKHTGAAE